MLQNGKKLKKVIFLDRDGVINKCIIKNRKCYAPTKFSEFKLYPHVKSSINSLRKKKFLIIIITNQPDISKNKIKKEDIKKINNLLYTIGVDEILICPHNQNAKCICRKPKTGLIEIVKKKYNINFKKSYLIGDRISDMELAENIKCQPLFINRYYLENQNYNASKSFYSIKGATKYILEKI